MAATTYECSECGALLKSPQELAAGKKIRCPKCSKVFTIGGAAAPAVAGKAGPAAVAVSKAAPPPPPAKIDDDDDEGGSYIFKEDNSAPSPTDAELNRGNKKKREDDEDEDDDLDDGDKPRKKKKKGSKKKKAGSGSGGGTGSKVVLIIAGILVLLLLGSAGGGAYLYLNWYKNRGSGKEEPLALLPADCNMVAYVNLGTLSAHPTLTPMVDRFVSGFIGQELFEKMKTQVGIEPKDLMDQVYFGLKVNPDPNAAGKPNVTMVLKSKIPFDQNKMRTTFKEATPERVGWRTYFKIKETKGPNLAYMPSDRYLVFSDIPEADFQAIVSSKALQPAISPELSNFGQSMDKEDAWFGMSIDEKMRQQMKAPGGLPPAVPMPPGLEAGLAKAKAMGFGATIAGSQAKFAATVDCGNDASAKRMADELEGMWNKQKGMLGLAAGAIGGKSGSVLVKDLTQSLRFASKGSSATASAQVSFDALKNVINEGMQASQAAQQQQPAGRMGNRGFGPAGNRGPGPGSRRGGRGGDK